MTILNINQSQGELDAIWGEADYYCYLRSPEFIEAFIKPIARNVNAFGHSCLDVACGEAVLFDHVEVPYVGLEASQSAIQRAARDRPSACVKHGRMESPDFLLPQKFGTIVFGGVMEVLIKPAGRVPMLESYLKFEPEYFIIYDLIRLDTSAIDRRFERIRELDYQATANLDSIIDAKKHRKILVYKCQ